MAAKIRLMRMGRKKIPSYRIVVADAKNPRDGRFIEMLGFYNPLTEPATLKINTAKALRWLSEGAEPTDTVHSLLSRAGVLNHWEEIKKGAEVKDIPDVFEIGPKPKEKKVFEIPKPKVEEEKAEEPEAVTEIEEVPEAKVEVGEESQPEAKEEAPKIEAKPAEKVAEVKTVAPKKTTRKRAAKKKTTTKKKT